MAWWWRFVVTLVVVVVFVPAQGLSVCNRTPAGATLPKQSGDNGFSIKISGNPQKYVPGEVYTVSLKGVRVGYSVQRFTAFLLVVEAISSPINLYGPHSFGTFTLFPDALTMYDDDCPNAITQTSSLTKTEVQVLWTAPPAGSGCVRFRAMVVESRDVWYMDDGELTKELCEDVQESDDVQPDIIRDCSACDEAKYEVTFEGLWSRQTHPKDFPTNEWLTHFSDIIGASHSVDYRVWVAGEHASDGLKQVAEWGSTRELESELKRQSDHIRTIIKARGLWHPNVNGKTFAVFRVDNRHHLMSLVSMLGPTPDWIVGVSALELCQANGTWIPQKTLNLYPYDAGTDSGVTYESANMPSIPREKIRRITQGYPNDPDAPFYDPTGQQMKPLARLTITRQRVYQKSCTDTRPLSRDPSDVSFVETSDEDAERMECQVTGWSEFTTCSVTCGKGLRQRSRNYIMPPKAQMMGCRRQLMEKEMCAGEQNFCGGGPGDAFSNPGHFDPRVCATSNWASWTPCSETCGPGIRMRNRRYLDRMGRKKCNEDLVEKEMCIADVPRCEDTEQEIIPPECHVTEWTDFSPCSATCGQGTTTRTRSYLVPAANQDQCSVNIMDRKPCQGERQDCSIDMAEAEEVCMQEKIVGPCRGSFHRFYFDKNTQRCKEFAYGGCHGNRNNFETHDECTRVCEMNKNVQMLLSRNGGDTSVQQPTVRDPYGFQPGLQPPHHHNRRGGTRNGRHGGHGGLNEVGGDGLEEGPHTPPSANHRIEPELVDCQVSAWNAWGQCSTTCGRSIKYRMRTIEVHPQNGGKRCPRKMKRQRKCKLPRCMPNNDFGGLESRSLHRDPLPGESFPSANPPPPYRPLTPSPHNPYPDTEYIAPGLFNPPTIIGAGDENLNFNNFQEGPTVDCEMSEWGPWSPCTHSCGRESLQQRSRLVVTAPRGGGVQCGDRNQRRYCTLPPCHRSRAHREPWNSMTGGDTWQP